MAKILYLSDGTTLEFTDESTVEDFVGVYTSFAAVDEIAEQFTTTNLIGAQFEGEILEDIVANGISVTDDGAGNVIAHFRTMAKSFENKVNQKIKEIELALAELAEEIGG